MKNEEEIMELNDEDSTEIFSLEEDNSTNLVDDMQTSIDNNLFSTYDEKENSKNLEEPVIGQAIISNSIPNSSIPNYGDVFSDSTQNRETDFLQSTLNESSVMGSDINTGVTEPTIGTTSIQTDVPSEPSIPNYGDMSNDAPKTTPVEDFNEQPAHDTQTQIRESSIQKETNSMDKNNDNANKDSKSNLTFILVFGMILLAITFLLPYISGYK